MNEKSKVYCKTDEQGRIVAINGGYTTPNDLTGWTQIDEGWGDRYNLCQSNYLEKPLCTMDGIYQYKLADGKAVERSAEELEVDRAALPPEQPSTLSRLEALESAMLSLIMGGVAHV